MPKVRIFKASLMGLAVCVASAWAQAPSVLNQVIEKTKEEQKKQLASGKSGSAKTEGEAGAPVAPAPIPVPEPVPELWSVSGINGELMAEIWLGGAIHRVPLRTGERLPGGWKLYQIDEAGVLWVRGSGSRQRRVTLRPIQKGSTGWEYAGVPRNTTIANVLSSSPIGVSDARAAAANLPALPLANPAAAGPRR